MTFKKKILLNLYLLLIPLLVLDLVGCCGRKKVSKDNNKDFYTKSLTKNKDKSKNKNIDNTISNNGVDIDISSDISLSQQLERTKELYEKLDYANIMLKKRNYDGSLREIKRIQQVVRDDPYLMTQTWALSAKVYDKMGNTSGRKRSYKRMLESLEELQKDSRYKNAYKDGMVCQKLIAYAKEKGGKNNDFE